MNIQRFSAFSDGDVGGNPAGVVIAAAMPQAADMQRVAADVGYSETAFAVSNGDGWRVRYFSPQAEVPFCGHATIALGAALAIEHGNGVFALALNDAAITVEGNSNEDRMFAALQSPPTGSRLVDEGVVDAALALFGYGRSDLDPRIPPAITQAGANHLVLALNKRSRLADMAYELTAGRDLMKKAGVETVNLVHAETPRLFHSRNAFAFGGVYEDPATGAAAAALAGYLRDLDWPHEGRLSIVQGEDMGMRSLISADFSDDPGSSIRVSGTVRLL